MISRIFLPDFTFSKIGNVNVNVKKRGFFDLKVQSGLCNLLFGNTK